MLFCSTSRVTRINLCCTLLLPCRYDWARTARLAVFNAGMGVLGHEYYQVLDGVSRQPCWQCVVVSFAGWRVTPTMLSVYAPGALRVVTARSVALGS